MERSLNLYDLPEIEYINGIITWIRWKIKFKELLTCISCLVKLCCLRKKKQPSGMYHLQIEGVADSDRFYARI